MRMRLIQPPVERLYNSVTMLPAQPLAQKTDKQPNNSQSKRAEVLAFFALLFIIDCYLYFRNPGHFFGFLITGQQRWIRSQATITVR